MNNKKRSLDLLGLLKFSATVFFVFHFIFITFENAFLLNSKAMMLTITVLFLFAIISLIKEFQHVQEHNQIIARQFSILEKIEIIVTYTLASFLTYSVHAIFDQSTIFAASIVTLLMVYFIPHRFSLFESTVYTGTITGMAESEFIHNWRLALLFGLISAVFYLIFQPSFRSTGGRAGLTAYITSLLFMYLFLDWEPGIGAQISPNMIFLSLLFIFAAGFITYFLQKKNILSIVKSAMLVTLIFEIIFPENLSLYSSAAFLGTIIAMSSTSRLKNKTFLSLVLFLSFLLFTFSYPLLSGATGKSGLTAVTGFLAADGIFILYERLKQRVPNELFEDSLL